MHPLQQTFLFPPLAPLCPLHNQSYVTFFSSRGSLLTPLSVCYPVFWQRFCLPLKPDGSETTLPPLTQADRKFSLERHHNPSSIHPPQQNLFSRGVTKLISKPHCLPPCHLKNIFGSPCSFYLCLLFSTPVGST